MSDSDLERRLTEIRDEIREVKRHVIGTNGDEGVLVRLTKVEERQGFLTTCYMWVVVGMFCIAAMVFPNYFKAEGANR